MAQAQRQEEETSAYQVAANGVHNGDVCSMVVRDMDNNTDIDTLDNVAGNLVYTRVHTVFFFDAQWLESFVTYIVFSTIMMHLTIFLPTSSASVRSSALSLVSPVALSGHCPHRRLTSVLPEVREFIRDAKPRTNTTREGERGAPSEDHTTPPSARNASSGSVC